VKCRPAQRHGFWRGFAGTTLTSMLLLLVAQAPLTRTLTSRLGGPNVNARGGWRE
jgi:hypothetical protein